MKAICLGTAVSVSRVREPGVLLHRRRLWDGQRPTSSCRGSAPTAEASFPLHGMLCLCDVDHRPHVDAAG